MLRVVLPSRLTAAILRVDGLWELWTRPCDTWALSSHYSGIKSFSNCSMEDFSDFISNQKSHCLQNQLRLQPTYKAEVCGNGVLEGDEVCDCGALVSAASGGCGQNPRSVHLCCPSVGLRHFSQSLFYRGLGKGHSDRLKGEPMSWHRVHWLVDYPHKYICFLVHPYWYTVDTVEMMQLPCAWHMKATTAKPVNSHHHAFFPLIQDLCVAHAGLKLKTTLLFQLPECWDCRLEPSCLAYELTISPLPLLTPLPSPCSPFHPVPSSPIKN